MMHIQVLKNGQKKGYIRSVNYNTGKFAIIQDKEKSKVYRTQAEIMSEIDTLTRFGFMSGYIFVMSV